MYSYICVLDFEATCDDNKSFKPAHEIIEFPSVLLQWNNKIKNYEKISEFQRFCKPIVNTQLTDFCKNLTGITQDQVDNGITFPQALNEHHQWLINHTDLYDHESPSVIIATFGRWDLITMLPIECKAWGIKSPEIYKKIINVKDAYKSIYHMKKGPGMARMLQLCNLTLDGRHHSGIDDCRNISKLVKHFTEKGFRWDDKYVLDVYLS